MTERQRDDQRRRRQKQIYKEREEIPKYSEREREPQTERQRTRLKNKRERERKSEKKKRWTEKRSEWIMAKQTVSCDTSYLRTDWLRDFHAFFSPPDNGGDVIRHWPARGCRWWQVSPSLHSNMMNEAEHTLRSQLVLTILTSAMPLIEK